jgi:hypothetical protein
MNANQVVAYTPTELATAQVTVRGWCAENIRKLLAERKDAEANLEQARVSKFRTEPFKRLAAKCEKQIEYFKKIGQAIKLGYMIVPNFEMDLFAVRTGAFKPKHREQRWANQFVENGQSLPAGEGRYVGPKPLEDSYTYNEKAADGKQIEKRSYFPIDFVGEIEFPVTLVKPRILSETRRAMGFKLFDQIGIARGGYMARRDDPIVCARIIDPTRKGKAVTFFVAWWLDMDML